MRLTPEVSRSTYFDALVCTPFEATSLFRFPHAVGIPGSGTGMPPPLWLSTRRAEHAGVLDDVKARPGSVE